MSKKQEIVLGFYWFTCFKPAMLLLFFWNTFSVFSAAPIYVKTIDRKPLQLYVNTSNDILLLQKGMLERYTADGIFFQNYGSIYINEHTEIVSVNSFKTILFSPDYGKIIQLDNRLKEIDIIDVNNLGTYLVSCVGSSYDNNFLWLYDAASQRLVKLDKNHTPIFESNTLSLLTQKILQPIQLIESGVLLYLLDEKNGIFVFDNQGNFIKNIPIESLKNIQIIDSKIYYAKGNEVYSYDQLTFLETRYTATPNLQQIHIGKAIVCGPNKDGFVEIWKF